MYERMPCRITDGPQTPEEELEALSWWQTIDEDAAYEELRDIELEEEKYRERTTESDRSNK